MKLLIPLACCFLFLPSCKKAIEKKKENMIVDAMTSGQWKVTYYKQDQTDLTASFSGYSFKYFENRTVDAIHSGAVERSGTWQENVDNLEIMASFPDATDPLQKLNGNWHIDKTDWTYVEASAIIGGSDCRMRLDKL
jgi:hypothetical protein